MQIPFNNPETRAVISWVLGRAGNKVTHAEGHGHALLLNEVTHPDLVLTNRTVCNGSFRSFCEQLRRRHPKVPVIMYSMDGSARDSEEALRSGISRYLTSPEELLDIARISATVIEQCG